MKYFKDQHGEVYAFEADGSQDDYIDPSMVPLTPEEQDRHLYPEKYMTPKQRRQVYLDLLYPLTRRQFRLVLAKHKLLKVAEETIDAISDPDQQIMARIEWEDSIQFERLNPTLLLLYKGMGLKESQVDSLWEEGLKL